MSKNFARYGSGGEMSITILAFILDYFQEKVMPKFFKKAKKTLGAILGPFWALFFKFGKKMNFSEKRAPSVFRYSNYLPSCKKSEKSNDQFLRKIPN